MPRRKTADPYEDCTIKTSYAKGLEFIKPQSHIISKQETKKMCEARHTVRQHLIKGVSITETMKMMSRNTWFGKEGQTMAMQIAKEVRDDMNKDILIDFDYTLSLHSKRYEHLYEKNMKLEDSDGYPLQDKGAIRTRLRTASQALIQKEDVLLGMRERDVVIQMIRALQQKKNGENIDLSVLTSKQKLRALHLIKKARKTSSDGIQPYMIEYPADHYEEAEIVIHEKIIDDTPFNFLPPLPEKIIDDKVITPKEPKKEKVSDLIKYLKR